MTTPPQPSEAVANAILLSLEGLCYGQITVTVHNGQVVQIDRTERQRFSNRETT